MNSARYRLAMVVLLLAALAGCAQRSATKPTGENATDRELAGPGEFTIQPDGSVVRKDKSDETQRAR